MFVAALFLLLVEGFGLVVPAPAEAVHLAADSLGQAGSRVNLRSLNWLVG
jgi:hypothetical protein